MRKICPTLQTRPRPAAHVPKLALVCIVALLVFVTQSAEAQGRCGAGVDLVVQALEKMRARTAARQSWAMPTSC